MRLGLTQSLRAEQRLIQSPQMIQAMQVLQLPLIELKDQVEQELQENVFLERQDDADRAANSGEGESTQQPDPYEDRLQREFSAEIDQLESRVEPSWRQRGTAYNADDEDKKFEALQNTPGRTTSLAGVSGHTRWGSGVMTSRTLICRGIRLCRVL